MSANKDNSLLYTLFNRSKKEDISDDKQFNADIKEIEEEIKELSEPDKETVLPGEWNPLTVKLDNEVRAPYLQIWIRPNKMQAKARRLEYIPPAPQEKSADEALQKKQQLLDLIANEKADEAEKADAQKQLEALELEIQMDAQLDSEAEQDAVDPYEWDDTFIRLSLSSVGIKEGISEFAIQTLLQKVYNTEIIIAEGTPQIDGEDGVVHEFFQRDAAPTFETRPDGSIDFKNMHLVTNVTKDTVIAELIPPKPGVVGVNVLGEAIMPRAGQAKMLPRGENTDAVKHPENPEILNLIAKIDGNLVFKKDKFSVENVYKVNGNVDNSTGNINFVGNVIVAGDVYEGYEIRTPGSIQVFGMVEGASLYAGGNINLEKGINGMSKGILEAGHEITAKFIENCKVRSGGNIHSESIINCQLECDGEVKVTGKGLISGGKLTVFGSVEAIVLGSRSSTPSTIILGITPTIIRERNELDAAYKKVCQEYDELHKNLAYIEAKHTDETDPNRQKLIAKLNGAMSICTLKKQRLELRRETIADEMRNVANCTFTCSTVYPPGRVTIGNSTFIIKETYNNCRFYRNSDGEISVGMK